MTEESAIADIDFEVHETQATTLCLEALNELFHLMPWGHKFVLSNGRTLTLKKFVEPKINRDGREEFGFDLVIENSCGGHIEFYVTRTGWGLPTDFMNCKT